MPFYIKENIGQRKKHSGLRVVLFGSCVNHKIDVKQADRVGVQVNLPLSDGSLKIKEILVGLTWKTAALAHFLYFINSFGKAFAVGYRNG